MTDGTKTPYGRRPLHQHSELSEEYPDEPNGVVPDLPFDLPDLPDPGDWPDIPMPNPPAIPDIPDLDPRNLDW